jgi:hypothetical protein
VFPLAIGSDPAHIALHPFGRSCQRTVLRSSDRGYSTTVMVAACCEPSPQHLPWTNSARTCAILRSLHESCAHFTLISHCPVGLTAHRSRSLVVQSLEYQGCESLSRLALGLLGQSFASRGAGSWILADLIQVLVGPQLVRAMCLKLLRSFFTCRRS